MTRDNEVERFVMPPIWEIDGVLYKVSLNETLMHQSPCGSSILGHWVRNLVFTPLKDASNKK